MFEHPAGTASSSHHADEDPDLAAAIAGEQHLLQHDHEQDGPQQNDCRSLTRFAASMADSSSAQPPALAAPQTTQVTSGDPAQSTSVATDAALPPSTAGGGGGDGGSDGGGGGGDAAVAAGAVLPKELQGVVGSEGRAAFELFMTISAESACVPTYNCDAKPSFSCLIVVHKTWNR